MKSLLSDKRCSCRFASAFTMIELLAILGVLTVLACVLAPALARTRRSTNSAQCLSNVRQLMAAWTMYADDSRAGLPPNRDGGNAGKSAGDASWAGGWIDYSSSTDNTNTALLVDHSRYPYGAYLGPYLRTATVFKCPSDLSMVSIGAQRYPRVRSVSMNGRVGAMARSWSGTFTFPLYTTVASLVAPKPSELFVLTDEHPGSINDPVFQVDPETLWQMIDYPAGYHNAAASFGFADGHVELHRWQDPRTVPASAAGTLIPLSVSLPRDQDVLWIQQHCAARR
ncbi:MAG TPA: type II secretion system protein [Verrucomicrobiae bacterium]